MFEIKEFSKDTIFDRVQSTIRTFFDCPDETITPQTVAMDINGWDSLSHTVFMLELENEFALKFSATEVLNFDNVSQVVDAVYSHMILGSINDDERHHLIPKIKNTHFYKDLKFRYPIFAFNNEHSFKMQNGDGFWEELKKSGFTLADNEGATINGEGGSFVMPCNCNPKDTITFYFKVKGDVLATAPELEVVVNDKGCAGDYDDEENGWFLFSFMARDYLPIDAVEGENTFRITLHTAESTGLVILTEVKIELNRWSDRVVFELIKGKVWGENLWRNLKEVGGTNTLNQFNNWQHKNSEGTDGGINILALGDSHATFNFGVYQEIRTHYLGPYSVFNFVKKSINLDESRVVQGHKILFCFGEIDCRVIIGSLADRIYPEELIDYLGEQYLVALNKICIPRDIEAAVVLITPPYPLNVNSDPLFPFIGALAERVEYVKMFNAKLRTLEGKGCITGVIDAYTPFATKDGVMDKWFAADETHLRPDRTDPLFAQVMAWASMKK